MTMRGEAFIGVGLRRLACVGLLVLIAGCGRSGPGAAGGSAGSAPGRFSATKEKPFENGLGMRFVPLAGTGVLISIWETRGRDYVAFMSARGRTPEAASGWAQRGLHPIAGVTWEEAVAFCQWLTESERAAGRLGAKDRYRLPTDREWETAVGPARYPWGEKWPTSKEWAALPGYKPDGGDNTVPVGSFAANALGLHDLGGNAFEWVGGWYRAEMNPVEIRTAHKRLAEDGGGRKFRMLRGASWVFWDPVTQLSAYRFASEPQTRGHLYGFRCVLDPEKK
jgi:formylglycine-generating enzyme required for sulfatase activity